MVIMSLQSMTRMAMDSAADGAKEATVSEPATKMSLLRALNSDPVRATHSPSLFH